MHTAIEMPQLNVINLSSDPSPSLESAGIEPL